MPGPTVDTELYSFQTLGAERRAAEVIRTSLQDAENYLGKWFGDQLQKAYMAGLSDGYAQGVHDRHKEQS